MRTQHTIYVLLALFSIHGCGPKKANEDKTPSGMRWIPGGAFAMGSPNADSYDHEYPQHAVRVNGFWMDEHEVTNKEFTAFVEATGYNTVAEKKPDWNELKLQLPPGTPQPPDSVLVAGSLVFVPPKEFVSLVDYSQWWVWTPGANWKNPGGDTSRVDIIDDYPVVHIAFEDAQAYCEWQGKRLPTEAEWEFASRGGNEEMRYAWGEDLVVGGKYMANTFQGSFPVINTGDDGFSGVAPVKSFPANGYGLYDMIGNVWEWTTDWYDVRHFSECAARGVSENPSGAAEPFDPADPYGRKRVTKGGSFLCASNYCSNYRPSARQGTAFDSGASNLGFRCVRE